MQTVYVKSYDAPPLRHEEILRYAGVRSSQPQIEDLLSECLHEACGRLSYRVCYTEVQIRRENGVIGLDFIKTKSKALEKLLEKCDKAVIFAATVGIELDRLISRYSVVSPSKSLILQAIGAERIESLCDTFEQEIVERVRTNHQATTARFSPGYGDLPLCLQKDIFLMLDCAKKIGLALNDSMLMSPSKSVTAIIGIKNC